MTLTPPSVLPLAEALMACPSVTPAAGLVFDCLEAQLAPLGFAVHRFVAGEAPDGPVENLFAVRQGPPGSRHFAFAGHLDVVPPGEGWTSAPFAALKCAASCSTAAARST
jgi:succinyl-diaminopimelate desuccinylase